MKKSYVVLFFISMCGLLYLKTVQSGDDQKQKVASIASILSTGRKALTTFLERATPGKIGTIDKPGTAISGQDMIQYAQYFIEDLHNTQFTIIDQYSLSEQKKDKKARVKQEGKNIVEQKVKRLLRGGVEKEVEDFPYEKIKENVRFATHYFPIVGQQLYKKYQAEPQLEPVQAFIDVIYSRFKAKEREKEEEGDEEAPSDSPCLERPLIFCKKMSSRVRKKFEPRYYLLEQQQGNYELKIASQPDYKKLLDTWFMGCLSSHEIFEKKPLNIESNEVLITTMRTMKQKELGTGHHAHVQRSRDPEYPHGLQSAAVAAGAFAQEAVQAVNKKIIKGKKQVLSPDQVNGEVIKFINVCDSLFLSYNPEKPYYNKVYENAQFGMKYLPIIEQKIFSEVKDVSDSVSEVTPIAEFIFVSRIPRQLTQVIYEAKKEERFKYYSKISGKEEELRTATQRVKPDGLNVHYFVFHAIYTLAAGGDRLELSNQSKKYISKITLGEDKKSKSYNLIELDDYAVQTIASIESWKREYKKHILPTYIPQGLDTLEDRRTKKRRIERGGCLVNDLGKDVVVHIKNEYIYLPKKLFGDSYKQSRGKYCWSGSNVHNVTVYLDVPPQFIWDIKNKRRELSAVKPIHKIAGTMPGRITDTEDIPGDKTGVQRVEEMLPEYIKVSEQQSNKLDINKGIQLGILGYKPQGTTTFAIQEPYAIWRLFGYKAQIAIEDTDKGRIGLSPVYGQ